MKFRCTLLLLFLIGSTTFVCAQKQKDSLNLKRFEFFLGSSPNVDSGSKTTYSATSFVFDRINTPIHRIENKFLASLSRVLNVTLVQMYLGGHFYGTINHEVFGHISRAKEVGIHPKLVLNFPALGGDYIFSVPHSFDTNQRLRIVAGGPEASIVIAHEATKDLYDHERSAHYIGNFLLSAKLFDGLLYIENDVKSFVTDPNQYYAANRSYFSRNPVPNDPLAYVLALTESYGYFDHFLDQQEVWLATQPDMSVYTDNEFIHDQYKRLKRAFTLAVLDPALLSFLQGTFTYLFSGKQSIRPLMLKLHDFRFMPSIRANYGELGAENYFDLYVKHDRFPPFSICYRTGGNMYHKISGAGLEVRNIHHKKSILAGQIDFWNNERDQKFNFHVYAKLSRQLSNSAFYLTAALGYKTKGLLIGKPYRSGIYGYLGGAIALGT